MPEREMEHNFEGILPEGWERSETSAGIPYYLNHNDGTTNWEHPTTSNIFSELDGMNKIKYGAYRTAMKLRAIQKMTHLNEVDHYILEQSCTEHGLGPGPTRNAEILSVGELEALLVSIFQLASRGRDHHYIQPEMCVELTLSFLLRCLDSGRTGTVNIRSLKIVLIALSQMSLELKYESMFKQVSFENAIGISQRSARILLQDLFLLTDSVSESNTFGQQYVDNAIESCWNMSGQPTDTVNKKELRDWMLKEPLCIVWLPTLHRLATAETVKHESKCSKCKAFPIVGFRYRCLKCSNVDFCQSCYWSQMTLKNHKITHPTREYCLATTTGDDVRDFMKQLKNKVTRKYRRRPLKNDYLKYPLIPSSSGESIPNQCLVFDNVHARVNLLASRLQELEDGAEETVTPSPSRSPLRYRPQYDDNILSSEGHSRYGYDTEASEVHISQPQSGQLRAQEPIVIASASSPPHQPPPPMPTVAKPLPDIKSKLKLESRIIELQGNNQAEVASRKKMEKHLAMLEKSKHEDLEEKHVLEQKVSDLSENNRLLKEKMTHLLATPPMTKTVKVPVPVLVQSPFPSMTEVRTSQFGDKSMASFSTSQVSSLLGGEEEEMEAILREILAAFPQQTTKTEPTEMNNKIFKSVQDVGNGLTSLVSHMKLT